VFLKAAAGSEDLKPDPSQPNGGSGTLIPQPFCDHPHGRSRLSVFPHRSRRLSFHLEFDSRHAINNAPNGAEREFTMIDLHNHILPGSDDGARDWRDSLEMARAAVDDGITDVVCTPHWVSCEYENGSARILEKLAQLQTLLVESKLPLQLHPGTELRLDPSLPSLLRSGDLLTINDGKRYALIELPMHVMPMGLQSFFLELDAHGIVPVIAHPERYPWVIEEPELVYRWVSDGFLVQITAASLLGEFGQTVERLSRRLLEHRLVQVIATDSHGLKMRSPKLSRARQVAAACIGEEAGWDLVRDNPAKIIAGRPLNPPEPIELSNKSGGWRRFFARFGSKRPADRGRGLYPRA